MKYLGEWKQENYLSASTKNLNKENLENRLLLFRELIKNPIEYSIILNIWLPDELKDELNQNEHIKINYEYCKLNTEEEAVVLEKAGKLNYPKAEQYQNVKVEVVAYDKYKAIEKVVKNLESYLEVYKHYLNIEKVAINVHCLLKDSGGNWGQMRTDSTDTHIFHRGMSEREKEDMKDFISLRDKIRLSEGSISTSINQLNNSLETLRKSIDDTQENRLLNNWSSLEYILNSYEGKSIIGKVIDIVPKVICLYHVKEQLNILWESIIRLTNSKDYEQLGNNREFNLAMLQRRKKI